MRASQPRRLRLGTAPCPIRSRPALEAEHAGPPRAWSGGPTDWRGTEPEVVDRFWARPADELLDQLATTPAGLSAEEAARRLARSGPNQLAPPRRSGGLALLARQSTDPIVLLLLFAAMQAIVLGDVADALIILAIVALSGLLGFWQEHRESLAVQRLLGLVQIMSRSAATAPWSRSRPPRSFPAMWSCCAPATSSPVTAGSWRPSPCRSMTPR